MFSRESVPITLVCCYAPVCVWMYCKTRHNTFNFTHITYKHNCDHIVLVILYILKKDVLEIVK